MHRHRIQFVFVLGLYGVAARAETPVQRTALEGVQPVATCGLQSLAERKDDPMMRQQVLYMLEPPPENPLDNYERTPLGDWRMPTSVDRGDPWQRLLLLGPKRPVVIDLAVFIDGRPFRESREAWIDELLKPAPAASGNNVEAAEGTKSVEGASQKRSADNEAQSEDSEKTTAKDTEETKEGAEEKAEVAPEKIAGEETEEKSKSKDDAKPAQSPGITAQRRQAPTMGDRLRDYLAAGGGAVDREEIRWLIAEWGSGPPVLLLGPSLSWQRAGFAPLLAYLDREQDGRLSAAEIAGAADSLRRADIDNNDVLDASEIRRAADRPVAIPFDMDHSLLVQLDATTDWDALATTMSRLYAARGANESAGTGHVRALMDGPTDVTLRIDFGTGDKPNNGVSVVAVSSELGDASKIASATKDVVTLDLGGDYIEFTAAQGTAGDKTSVSRTQVAIGAAIDGNPLMRLLDRDNDHRLTMRERQEFAGLLSALDRNGDRAVGADEMPMPIRFAVTLGPHVHEVLATPVGAARAIAPRESAPAAPAWFASMDKNHDGDLSRGEFLGTSEQFRQIDADSDGLVSIAEATKLSPAK